MKNKKKKLYDEFHKNTDSQKKIINDHNFTYHIITGVLNKYLKFSNLKILDIGCGAGTIDFYLARMGHDLTGIDISEKAISSCKATARELKLPNISFGVLDFPNKTPKDKFDVVLCFEVIEHLEDDNLALKKIYQLLKPNGVVILSTPSSKAPLYRLGYAKEFDKRVGHIRRYDVDELESMFKKNGFKILEIKKTEGLLRNFLFLNPYAGKFIKFLKYPIFLIFDIFDQIFLSLFGESDIFIIAKKH